VVPLPKKVCVEGSYPFRIVFNSDFFNYIGRSKKNLMRDLGVDPSEFIIKV
jgi:hypothetical protein